MHIKENARRQAVFETLVHGVQIELQRIGNGLVSSSNLRLAVASYQTFKKNSQF